MVIKSFQNSVSTYAIPLEYSLEQGWAIIQPEGPHWLLDFDEQAGQVVQEAESRK